MTLGQILFIVKSDWHDIIHDKLVPNKSKTTVVLMWNTEKNVRDFVNPKQFFC